jgi:anaerobic selenocysteine-containing dehydrogenase
LKRVQLRPAVVAPIGAARSDTDIVLGLAERLGMNAQFFGASADGGHQAVVGPAGLSVAQLRAHPEGIELPGEVALKAYAKTVDGVPKGFATPTRRIEIYSETLLDNGAPPVPMLEPEGLPIAPRGYPLRLGAAKIVAFCHSQHRNIASLRRLMPDPLAEIAPDTARERGIANGDWIRIRTVVGSAVAKAHVSRDLAEGTVSAQHGWWVPGAAGTPYDGEHAMAANLNQVVDTSRDDPVSGSIPMRASWCEVERLGS